jgi:hypothetical protein
MALGLVALFVWGAVGILFGWYEWHRMIDYRSPYLFEVRQGERTPPLTHHVLFVLVDGLRNDVAHTLPAFRRVASEGSFLTARTGIPSLSLPGWTFLTTGAPGEVSGVTTNWFKGPEQVDSVIREALHAGLRVRIVATRDWRGLYGNVVPDGPYYHGPEGDSDPLAAQAAKEVLRAGQPDLMYLYLPDVDSVSHEHGSLSPQALATARRASAIIGQTLDAVAPDTIVLMTSDHGHITQGGHGGYEHVVRTTPFAVGGPGIANGITGEVSQGDVAPTIAALLGLPRPEEAVGRPLLSLLDADAATKAAIARNQGAVSTSFFRQATAVLGGSGDDFGAWQHAQEAKAAHDTLWRTPLVVFVLAVLGVVVWWATRRLDPMAVAIGVGILLAVWIGGFFALGLSLSFSELNSTGHALWVFLSQMVLALIGALVGAAVAGAVAARRGRSTPFRTGTGVVAWALFAQTCVIGALVAAYGWGFTWHLPNMSAFVAENFMVLAGAALGVFAGIVGLAGSLGAKVIRH